MLDELSRRILNKVAFCSSVALNVALCLVFIYFMLLILAYMIDQISNDMFGIFRLLTFGKRCYTQTKLVRLLGMSIFAGVIVVFIKQGGVQGFILFLAGLYNKLRHI